VARPRIWQPFEKVKWASTHQFTDAGDIRDQHRNVIPVGTAPNYDISLRLYDTARKITLPRRDILALEFFGPPPSCRCVICDKILPTNVLHLNKNPRDFARDNLKYGNTVTGRIHEIACINWAMRHNHVPPRAKTQRKRYARLWRHVRDDDDWGSAEEEMIPLLGINPKGKEKEGLTNER
jgi:hypothetical protein